jgi:uncharacterized protein
MIKNVTFKKYTLNMAGNLHLPADMDEAKKYSALVVLHPAGGVKEQTAGLYAQKLSEEGYITLAFDAAHQGESEGLPRYLDDPDSRVEDVRAAVDYLTTLSFVDPERIGIVGICAGGGYAVKVPQTERRIKAVATVSAADMGRTFREGWSGGAPPSSVIETLEAVAKQRTAEVNGAEPAYLTYAPEEVDENTDPEFAEAHEYYKTPRGQHPNSVNKVLLTSYDKILAFTAIDEHISTLLTQPLLLVAGSKAETRWQSEEIYKFANEPKELVILEGASHFDMYDMPQYVDQAVAKMVPFFNEYLTSNKQ